ncbi:F0F1 ATP synthase subunit I [Vibrio fluvialis]|jgi:ATP synthase protein I|uniref:ATP F0F1 synthase subunit I n=1 Tax=Vibrio fluvialis TaxID=676 RepID=A0AAX2LRX4_VIBFL|nr:MULTISPECIES: F0F1 ATP synthase subunit I [Vibrio]TNF15810.1 MAG: F0F1 ATP synthase subunit I [Vibrionaceae bacterium]HDM8035200.1 F0F1 ATP synthase subunit I [Vibrio fluvialis clinical-1]AMF95702.1 ATP F0F1 synthase subunit I [Vibrio fluvialis]AVH31684.1 ATP F0F1 synthase subunit I [Vibrio fluvialis]EKO3370007.1 F0F1 ATP synthase subunit I [Vibrio fluvialis]
MVAALARPGRALAKQLLMIQFGAVIVVAAGMAIAVNAEWGFSALVGGGIFVFANAVFALCAFMYSGARAAKRITASFYTGEALKILITVALFSVAYMYMQVELVPLKLTYLLALGINICAPVLFINNKKIG